MSRVHVTNADPFSSDLALHHPPPLLLALLHPQQRRASWVGQGEGAARGEPLQTFWLVGLQMHHLHSHVRIKGVGGGV